jgi:hypothetical protein
VAADVRASLCSEASLSRLLRCGSARSDIGPAGARGQRPGWAAHIVNGVLNSLNRWQERFQQFERSKLKW